MGYNLLSDFTSLNQADAMTRGIGVIDVSNNSWGAPDATGQLIPADVVWRAAVENGVTTGRGGLGINYLYASGNGYPFDNANYDGYANNPYVIAVAFNAEGSVLRIRAWGQYSGDCSGGEFVTPWRL